jgi:O-antigen ligase
VRAVVPVFPGRYAAVGFFRWYQRLAHDLLPPLCLAAAVALHGGVSRRLRWLLGAAALLAAAAVVLTLSRLAWATLVLAGVLLVLPGAARLRRVGLPLVALGAAAMLLHPGVRVRLAHLATPDATGDRQKIWSVCRAVIADRPLTGVGWGNLPQRSVPYWERLHPEYPLRAWCHDAFLSAWAEGGPLLFAAVLAFFALLARAAWRSRRGGDPLARAAGWGALVAVAVTFANALAHDLLYSSEATYALMFAVGTAAALARGDGGPR